MRQAEYTAPATGRDEPQALADEVRVFARSLGFHRVGFARADAPLDDDHARYRAFVDAGMHGSMDWLARDGDARRTLDHDAILPGARSVIVCAMGYHRDDAAGEPDVAGAQIARYARGSDYHNFMRKKLRRLAAWLRTRVPGAAARPMVDTSPVLERAWARRAGIGFVGKNGLVIAPGLGSFVLLGEVVTTAELAVDEPMESRCGTCTACLDACPTRALVAPFVLDARRCVAYLTIELCGPMPDALREGVGSKLFGCDDCQDVCPYNRTAPPPSESTRRFAADPRRAGLGLADIAALDAARFDALTEGSPLARPGRDGLVRNALVVMGNARSREHLPTVERIAADARETHSVRDAAHWAIGRIAGPSRAGERTTAPRHEGREADDAIATSYSDPPAGVEPPSPPDGILPRPPREA